MKFELKVPAESSDYAECSRYVTGHIGTIIKDSIARGSNFIWIRTNLKRGLPLENINKVAGPLCRGLGDGTV